MLPTIVSFYTQDFQYPQHAQRLKAECEARGLRHYIQCLPSTGSYLGNTRLKPFFLREALALVGGPILWIDVDGSILNQPLECEEAYTNGMDVGLRPITKGDRVRRWHVGTIWLKPGYLASRFLDEWCKQVSDMTDESALHHLDKERPLEHWLRVWHLPPRYFYIGKTPPPDTVVMHRLSGHAWKQAEYRIAEADERKNG